MGVIIIRIITIPLYISGIILLILAGLPLIEFVEGLNNVTITTQNTGTSVHIILNYNDTAPLRNYVVEVYSNGVLVDSKAGSVLSQGDKVTLNLPYTKMSKNITITIKGSVYGMYPISISISG